MSSKGDPNEFSKATKELIARRAGHLCSLPRCRIPTSGSHSEGTKSTNLGEAAHIRAAKPGGARHDLTMTPEQRSDPSNGIWTCGTHHKLVDNDEGTYTVEQLVRWRDEHHDWLKRVQEGGWKAVDYERSGVELKKWWNSFVGVPCEFGGRKLFLAWHGPFDDLVTLSPRDVSEAELGVIYKALCKYDALGLVQPHWYRVQSETQKQVWELDEQRTERRRLRSARVAAFDPATSLVVRERRDGCLPYCPRCGKTVAGNNCSDCGIPLDRA